MRAALLMAVCAVALVTPPASAQTAADIVTCRGIKGTADRLKCYDSLSIQPPAEATSINSSEGEKLIANWEGDGTQTTRPFHADGPWELRWTLASSFWFAVFLYDAKSGTEVNMLASQTIGRAGSSYVPKGGDYYLEFTGYGSWSARAVGIPRRP
jgi:hypothetical protein